MTLVLNGKGLLLEGSNPKIEDKQVPGIYIYMPRTQMGPLVLIEVWAFFWRVDLQKVEVSWVLGIYINLLAVRKATTPLRLSSSFLK